MGSADMRALPLSIIQTPKGVWIFVGSVPAELAFTFEGDPARYQDALDTARHCGPGFARHLGLRTRTFETREAAELAAKELS
jgi:hypothetical protein